MNGLKEGQIGTARGIDAKDGGGLRLHELDVVDTAREPGDKAGRASHMSKTSDKRSAYRYHESKQGLYEKVLKHKVTQDAKANA